MNAEEYYDIYGNQADPADLLKLDRDVLVRQIAELDAEDGRDGDPEAAADGVLETARWLVAHKRMDEMDWSAEEEAFIWSDRPNMTDHIAWLVTASRTEIVEWMAAGGLAVAPIAFDVIFDNGGGITLQTSDGFTHHYDDPAQVAADVRNLLKGQETDSWEGNEHDAKLEYDEDTESNGGYRWLTGSEIRYIISAGCYPSAGYNYTFGHNDEQFFKALGVTVEA